MSRISLLLLIFIFSTKCFAQKDALGSWNIVGIRYHYNQKVSIFGEAQLRSLRFYDNFHYHEAKAGVTVKVNPKFNLSLAGGKYDTYGEGDNFVRPKNNAEFRIWPQIVFLQSIGRFEIEHRYRVEGRFTSNGYRNRYRFRLGAYYPFGKEKKGFKPFQVGVSNEVFFTNREPYFERNRLLTAITYNLSKNSSVQLGYLYQFDYKINDETGTNFFVIGYSTSLKRKTN